MSSLSVRPETSSSQPCQVKIRARRAVKMYVWPGASSVPSFSAVPWRSRMVRGEDEESGAAKRYSQPGRREIVRVDVVVVGCRVSSVSNCSSLCQASRKTGYLVPVQGSDRVLGYSCWATMTACGMAYWKTEVLELWWGEHKEAWRDDAAFWRGCRIWRWTLRDGQWSI